MAEGGDFGSVEAEVPLAFDLDPVDGVGLVDAGVGGTPAGGVVGPLFGVDGGGQPVDVLRAEGERRLDGVGPVCAAALVGFSESDEVIALARAVVERFGGGGVEGPLVRGLAVAVEGEAFPVAAVVEGVRGVPGGGVAILDAAVEPPTVALKVHAPVVRRGLAEDRECGDEAEQGEAEGDTHVSTYILAVWSG